MRLRLTVAGAALTTVSATLLATLPTASAHAVAPADGRVFINEIHYDNAGTDIGEAVEIAGPAGTDLTGWSLVLYNGNGGAPYNTRSLHGVIADQGAGFGAVSVTWPSNGIQNGAPDGLALVDAGGQVVQFLSYEGLFVAVSGPAAGSSSTEIPVAQSGADAVGLSLQLMGTGRQYGHFAWAAASAASFGSLNDDQSFGEAGDGDGGAVPQPGPCELPVTHEIGAVQGSGATSPLAGQPVTVEGVVVGDFQGSGQFDGVHLQDPDGDAASSDGIFVHVPGGPALAAGDVVRASGTVEEFNGLTEVTAVTAIADCGDAAVPAATALALPAEESARERVEGMLVSVPEPLTVTDTFTLARFGELVLSSEGRLFQPTNDGGDDNAAEQRVNDSRRLVLDDGSSRQNPRTVPFSDPAGDVVRVGDTLTGVTGVLTYGFGAWRVQPTADGTVQRSNPRSAAPDAVGGAVQVASFNVLNYFTTLDRDGATTDNGAVPRGANSVEEFQRQQAKIVSAILRLDADVVGLMEIENDSDDAAVENLVAALNATAGERRYAAVEEPDTGAGLFGTDAIKTALIYQPRAVVPVDPSLTTQDEAFSNARLPLAQRFRPAAGGKPFAVVVNHFKSKGCGGATGANADQGDGQGCWNADRVRQAHALLELIGTLPDKDVLVVGDLNSYGGEDPVDVLTGAGFVDLVDTELPEAEQYSYVFSGQSGYLDHGLASPGLAARVSGVDIWHINADEPVFLDYNTEFNPRAYYQPGPYRSSDHDPVLVGVRALPGVVTP